MMVDYKKTKNLGVNSILNAIKNGLSIIFPLITYPYAFRTLHAEGIGKVNYAASIVNYFTLLAGLGISTYATREGAKVRDDRTSFNLLVNEVFSINAIATMFSYSLLIVFLVFVEPLKDYRGLIIIQSLSIFFHTMGVEWLNNIYEDFLFITIRSLIIHIVTICMLFIFVKTEEDFYVYAFLTVVTQILICVSNWIYCRRYVYLRFTFHMNIKKHIIPVLTMFATAAATNIYVNLDVTMLGWISGDYYVGLYESSVKIYTVIKKIVAAVYVVAVPRMAFYVGKKDISSIKKTYTALLSNVTLLLLPAGIGLISISREVILIMGGQEYEAASLALQILGLGLIGAVFGGIINYCLNIPLGRENINAKATIISALINVGLNIFMIPAFKHNGAAVTTVISEFFVFGYCMVKTKDIKKYVDLRIWKKSAIHGGIGCIMIICIAFWVHQFVSNVVVSLLVIIILSTIAYFFALYILKNPMIILFLEKKKGVKNR